MDVKEIRRMGKSLSKFLGEFDDCFGRSEPRQNLRTYIKGQLSHLPRKSIEPIALSAGVPPRTLQVFLSISQWNHQRMLDKTQWIVARDHSDRNAIGVVDDSGNPKKGKHTAGVQRQWCGNTGKIDNCVVGVHISYVAGDFQCLLDSDVYLPKGWADDIVRRRKACIPDEVTYRKKTDIALDQIRRAIGNGVRVSAWTFDEWYGRDSGFLGGLDVLGQSYIGEVPSTFTGWSHQPQILQKASPQEAHKRGAKRQYPRLASKALAPSEVRNLLTYSRQFQNQKWKKFKIKDGEKGPIVWEIKHVEFYRKHRHNGLPGPRHTLIVARNVADPNEVKYFVSNMVPGSNGVSIKWMLWVAFSRWPVERCFELGKRDLGMDHFETRSWQAIHRHFYISQLSLLFCARVQQRLREKNDTQYLPNGGTGSKSCRHMDRSTRSTSISSGETVSRSREENCLLPRTEQGGPSLPYEKNNSTVAKNGRQSRTIELVHSG